MLLSEAECYGNHITNIGPDLPVISSVLNFTDGGPITSFTTIVGGPFGKHMLDFHIVFHCSISTHRGKVLRENAWEGGGGAGEKWICWDPAKGLPIGP